MEDPLPCHEELRKWGKSLAPSVRITWVLEGVGFTLTWFPKVYRIMAFWAIFRGFGPLLGVKALNPVGILTVAG